MPDTIKIKFLVSILIILLKCPLIFAEYKIVDTYSVSYLKSPFQNEQSQKKIPNDQHILRSPLTIEIYPHSIRQKMWGFGASITESCFDNLYKLNKEDQDSFFKTMFSKKEGAGLDILRIPIGGYDFSRRDYTLNDSSAPDLNMENMNFTALDEYIEFAKKALEINPKIKFMISPWSPPAWMKFPQHLRGGEIQSQYFYQYGLYLIKTIKYLESQGINISYLTVLNEPVIEGAKTNWHYQQAYMSAKHQEAFITNYLKPLLTQENLQTQILAHDHNWDNANDVISKFQDNRLFLNSIGGIAYHCYGGQFKDFINSINTLPQQLPIFHSECSAIHKTSHFSTQEGFDFIWWLQNQTLDVTRAGSRGAMGWNLCLDQSGNPHNGGCPNCRGLVTINEKEPQLKYKIYKNPEWFALAQLSKFVDNENTYKIDSTDTGSFDLQNVAFLNANNKVVLVIKNSSYYNKQVLLKIENSKFGALIVPALGAVSVVLEQ